MGVGTGCSSDEGDQGGLLEEVRFEQRLEDEGSTWWIPGGREFQAEGSARTKAQRKDSAWHV